MSETYYRRYCHACLCVHWVEVLRRTGTIDDREICHGENFFPRDDATHYARRAPGGGVELVEKMSFGRRKLSLEWQILASARNNNEEF